MDNTLRIAIIIFVVLAFIFIAFGFGDELSIERELTFSTAVIYYDNLSEITASTTVTNPMGRTTIYIKN